MTRGRALRRRRLTLVTESEPKCGCALYPLWTLSQGYVSTCKLPEHYGRPLSAHPSLVVAK